MGPVQPLSPSARRVANYRRGLFRLWVILAVFWIGGVAWMSGPTVNQEFGEPPLVSGAA